MGLAACEALYRVHITPSPSPPTPSVHGGGFYLKTNTAKVERGEQKVPLGFSEIIPNIFSVCSYGLIKKRETTDLDKDPDRNSSSGFDTASYHSPKI
jgi:hypothetical protein